jgi:hypothetical protein
MSDEPEKDESSEHMQWFDAHCHLQLSAKQEPVDALMSRLQVCIRVRSYFYMYACVHANIQLQVPAKQKPVDALMSRLQVCIHERKYMCVYIYAYVCICIYKTICICMLSHKIVSEAKVC